VGDRASLLGYKDVHSSKKGLFSFKFINQNLAQQTLEKFKGFEICSYFSLTLVVVDLLEFLSFFCSKKVPCLLLPPAANVIKLSCL
jgi:hypothetical protein